MLSLKVVAESWILIVSLHFEFFIGVVEEDGAEGVVGKADDGVIEGELLYHGERGDVSTILDGL